MVLRLPLVKGKKPLGNLGAMIKAIKKDYYFRISKGEANLITELFNLNGIYNLTDNNHPMISEIANKFNMKNKSIPICSIKFIAKIGDLIYFFSFNSSKVETLT